MKKLPKVLIFIDWYLPGFMAGGPIQSCANLVAHLERDFSFYIVTRNTDYTSTVPYETVVSDEWNDVNGSKVFYTSKKSLKSSKLRSLIKEVHPEVVYVNGVYSLYFSILPIIISKQLGYQKILVAGRGMLAQSAIQVKPRKKKLFLKLAKFYNLYRNVTFHATTSGEEMDIRSVIGLKADVRIAPNLPTVPTSEESVKSEREKLPGELRLVSVARISPEKNTKFALEVLLGYTGGGVIQLDLYGPIYDNAYWGECESIIAQLPANISVSYKGSLEKKMVHGALQNYHALFMPTRGENFGHIILESFTAGCMVLISDQTPWRNLAEREVGYDLPLNDMAAFRKAINEMVYLNQQQFNALSDSAKQFAFGYCQDESLIEANKSLFRFN